MDLRFHKKCLISYSWSLFVFVTSNVLYFWPLAFCIFDHQPFCISNQQHFVFVTSSISWFHLKPVLLGPFQTLHEDGYKTSIVGSCLIFVSMNDSNMFSKFIFAGPNYYRRYCKGIQIICPQIRFTLNGSLFTLLQIGCVFFLISIKKRKLWKY